MGAGAVELQEGVGQGAENLPRSRQYRPDIDGLRAIAVLSVVGFHVFPGQLKGGFVGVDVFFVISGFLISSIIIDDLRGNSFSIWRFYARRIRRIFPALLVVLAACLAFGWFTLMIDEYKQLGRHTFAGAGFFSNLALWGESGYFDSAAEAKPLLHLWSLGVEEQFYIVWPFVLWIARKRSLNFTFVIVLLGVSSFALNIWATSRDAVGAFYSPQTRVWELAIGALLASAALAARSGPGRSARHDALSQIKAFIGAALIVVALCSLTKEKAFPGWWAAVPTVGAAFVISAGPGAWLNRAVLSHPVLTWVGLISFPLYLWHWPLLAFLRIIHGAQLPVLTSLAAVGAAVVLASLTHVFIERPIRFGTSRNRVPAVAAALMFGVACTGFIVDNADGLPRRPHLVAAQARNELLEGPLWQFRTNETCEERYPADFRYFCIQSKSGDPTLIVLGDSYANHLYPGLARSPRLTAQSVLSYGSCTPSVLTLDENVRRNCEVQDRIVESTPSLRFAILSSRWPRFDRRGQFVDYFSGEAVRDARWSASEYMDWLDREIGLLEDRGIKVIVFGPKPEFSYDIRECFARPLRRSVETCSIPRTEFEDQAMGFRTLVAPVLTRHPKVSYFEQAPLFCDESRCSSVQDGMPLLRDPRHYSRLGSDAIAGKFVSWAENKVPEILDRKLDS
jgi:peptidoglycan/LPS O-acetylase OafA/YrhL